MYFHLQALVTKVNSLLTKTIKSRGIKGANALVSLCPSTLQTKKMVKTDDMVAIMPLVNASEWERYIALPAPLHSGTFMVRPRTPQKSLPFQNTKPCRYLMPSPKLHCGPCRMVEAAHCTVPFLGPSCNRLFADTPFCFPVREDILSAGA